MTYEPQTRPDGCHGVTSLEKPLIAARILLQDSAAISALQVRPVPKNPEATLTLISMTTSHAVIFSRVSQDGKQSQKKEKKSPHNSTCSSRLDWLNADGFWVDIPPQSLQKESYVVCIETPTNSWGSSHVPAVERSDFTLTSVCLPNFLAWYLIFGAILSHNLPSAAMSLQKVGMLT